MKINFSDNEGFESVDNDEMIKDDLFKETLFVQSKAFVKFLNYLPTSEHSFNDGMNLCANLILSTATSSSLNFIDRLGGVHADNIDILKTIQAGMNTAFSHLISEIKRLENIPKEFKIKTH